MKLRALRRRAGLTLIEVIISAAILAGLALVALNATTTMVSTTNTTTVAVDLERAADKLLTELRREVRQSGYRKISGSVGLAQVWIVGTAAPGAAGTGTAIRFRRRIGDGDLVTAWDPSAGGTTWVEYIRQPSGNYATGDPRYRIVRRTFDTATSTAFGSVDVLDGASAVSFTLVPADEGVGLANPLASVSIDLTMARAVGSEGANVASGIRLTCRRYEDRIRLLNPR